jgi:hypothetical protein
MSKNKIYLKVNNNLVDTLSDVDFNFRLNRFVQDVQNFQVRGGDYTTELEIPFTKNNVRVFGISYNNSAINKFNREVPYTFELGINGFVLISGTCLLQSISKQTLTITFLGTSIDWIRLFDDLYLNRLGYVNDLPTWFGSNKLGQIFEGGKTINIVNELDRTQTDYICPMIVRYNTPLTDYLPYSEADIFGLYDGGGNQILQPLDFPNVFNTVRGFFGSRQGLTFMDLPPAIYYRNILEKCFESVGYNIDCSLFNEDWFNRLYIPFQGDDFYKYNWKTLAELQLKFIVGRNYVATTDFIYPPAELFDGLSFPTYKMAAFPFNLCKNDDTSQRVDRIANFNKFLVTDDDNGYVVPANGKYKIKFKSIFQKSLLDLGSGNLTFLGTFGSSTPNYGWDDNVFVIFRKNQTGDYVLTENPLNDVIQYMNNDALSEFTESPSDIIAYVSPKRCIAFGNNDVRASGSPLTNFDNVITVINTTHNITSDTITDKSSVSSVEFEVVVDLLQNERVNFACVTISDIIQIPIAKTVGQVDFTGNNSTSEFSIEYLCGYEDISLSDNLPEISCRDFIKNFVNTFNLRFHTQGKIIKFLTDKEFYNNDIPYDITQRVADNSIKYTPSNIQKNIMIGYTNDELDAELTIVVSECVSDVNQVSKNANKMFNENPNIYSSGTSEYLNGFSATKFIEADLSGCVDYNTITKTLITIPNPITGDLFTKGIQWGTKNNFAMFRMQVPSIQTFESLSETTVGALNYDFSQGLRILQYYGTVGTIYYTNGAVTEDYRFKIDAPEFAIADDIEWWVRPTISSFDLETPYYPVYSIPSNTNIPNQSLRYDISNGLYDKFFSNIIEQQNKSYVLSCEAYLTSKDWNMLQANRIVKLNESLYKLIEISDYDVTGIEPCKIVLIKII